jgi:polysaccharide chain length determinant protein (PEP-CTERM system associated)
MLPGKTYSVRDFIQIARKRATLLVVLPIVTLFGALVYSSTLPNVYQSSMLIAIVPQRVPNEFVRSTVTLSIEERLGTITVQVMSRSVLEPLITEFDLYPEERAKLPMEDVVNLMRGHVDVEPVAPRRGARPGELPAFYVRFKYSDALIASKVTQRLGTIFSDQNARDRGAIAKATDDFLQVQLDEARQRLEEQEKRLEQFRKRNGMVLPTQLPSNLQAVQSTQMQIQAVVEAIARDRDRKLMLERLYQDASAEPEPQAVTGSTSRNGAPENASAKQRLAAARSALAVLERRLTPEHPDIAAARRAITDLEDQAAAEEKVAAALKEASGVQPPESIQEVQRRERLRQMRAEIESIDRLTSFKEAEERRLRDLAAEYQRRIEAVPGIESEWAALTRDYDTQQRAYRDLLQNSEASKVALDLENRRIGEYFRVLDRAVVPRKPVSPVRIQITGIGFAVGLLLGIGIVVLLEIKDSAFRSEADVRNVLALPVLAMVPFVESPVDRRRRVRRFWMVATAGVLLTVGASYVFWAMRLWTVVV